MGGQRHGSNKINVYPWPNQIKINRSEFIKPESESLSVSSNVIYNR